MISKWRVYSNPIYTDKGIKVKYGICRTMDESGNRQTSIEMYDTYQEAKTVADLMNNKAEG